MVVDITVCPWFDRGEWLVGGLSHFLKLAQKRLLVTRALSLGFAVIT